MKLSIYLTLLTFVSHLSCNVVAQLEDDDEQVVLDPRLNRYQQDDPRLIKTLREKYIIPRPKSGKRPKLVWATSTQNMMGQFGQAGVVDDLYK